MQIIYIAVCLLPVFILIGCGEKSEKKAEIIKQQKAIYYCPMHPQIQQDKPGKCPIPECHEMELILKTSDTLLENTLKPVNTSVLASVKTIKPVFHKMNLDIEANGYIDYDNRTEHNISTLYSGRIEKLNIKYLYQPVHKGDIIFEIYSPELVTAQENLVYLLKNDPEDSGLINSLQQKLKLLGFSNNLLDEITKTKIVYQSVPVYSPYEGRVRPAMKPSPDNINPMTSQKKNRAAGSEELSIKEGMYVMMGETIFNIISPDKLSVILQIKPEEISKVKVGAEVEMEIDGNIKTTMKGKIDFIEPRFKEGFKTITAKIYFDNSSLNLKVGDLVRSKIKGQEMDALWIPLTALVDLGKEKIVWVRKNRSFIAVKVETGVISNNMIEISDGLTEEDEIASEAHYLTDSEGFINVKEDEK